MIQFFLDSDKPLTQKSYNEIINELNISSLRCSSCGFLGDCTRHSYYKRNIVTDGDGKIPIKVLRVQCGQCNVTHAILPTSIVPYSQILLGDHLEIIRLYENGISPHQIKPANPEIDVWSIVYIIKQYLVHWQQRLKSYKINLCSSLTELTTSCFKHHNRQFMQIKRTPNSLFIPPT